VSVQSRRTAAEQGSWQAGYCGKFFGVMKNSAPRSVLVVDDEPLLRWSIAETLRDEGHRVAEAPDAAAALRAVEGASAPFDVVVLDCHLPDCNGPELLEALRHVSPASAVILMTAFSWPELVKRATELGVSRVLQKPFDVAEVGRAVVAECGS
jgi:two-component system response regulator AtoC